MDNAGRPTSSAGDSFATVPNTPYATNERDVFLEPPRASYLDSDTASSTPYIQSTPANSSPLLDPEQKTENNQYTSQDDEGAAPVREKRSPFRWLAIAAVAIVIVVLAVILPVYFTVIKPHHHGQLNSAGSGSSSSGSSSGGGGGSSGSGPGNPKSPTGAISGGDGSVVTASDGSTFTYSNKFGGFWVDDPNDPYNDNAQPNSWTPPLNTSWTWGKDRVFGVNLGGLFVLEPFITPAIFQKYPGAVDEWTLSTLMAADTANGGLNQLEDHYNTFVTEQDIAQIAGAGLNWIRVPIPFWAVDTWPGEPFLAQTSWKYFVRLLGWARKYGIRVNIDLHTIPGSQNGYNHSGKEGEVNFLFGVMGVANAQRTLNYIRFITEFISQPQYSNVAPMFGIVNEALVSSIGKDQITSFYLETHNMIRSITGYGQGNGPYISIHDGFQGVASWADFLPGSDRVMLDTHPYFAFNGQPNTDPIATGTGADAGGVWPQNACQAWGPSINTSQTAFGVTAAGEFSTGFNDCGLYLKGIPGSHTYGGDCSIWQDATNWNASVKAGIMQFALASMDATQNFFFWTWKIGNDSISNTVASPLWSYQLGLENGFIPTDPRDSVGVCASLGVSGPAFDGTYLPWQTGGAGAGTIAATASVPWPPAVISGNNGNNQAALLPTYTQTGAVETLPPPTLTASVAKSVSVANGWFDASDTASAYTAVAGCTYPNAWDAVAAAVPPLCGAGGVAVAAPTIATTIPSTATTSALTTTAPPTVSSTNGGISVSAPSTTIPVRR